MVQIYCSQNYDSNALDWMDLFNSTLIPFIVMIFLSIILIFFVYHSRSKMHSRSSSSTMRRDLRFSVSIISLNVIFLILNLPITIVDLLGSPSSIFEYISDVLYFMNYAISFYVQVVVNIDFRNEFLKLFNFNARNNRYRTDQSVSKLN